MKVIREYPTHHYVEFYEKTKLFCPNCGVQDIWEQQSAGDYYCGPEYVCTTCKFDFTIQGPSEGKDAYKLKIIDQLKSGITHEPKTRPGT